MLREIGLRVSTFLWFGLALRVRHEPVAGVALPRRTPV